MPDTQPTDALVSRLVEAKEGTQELDALITAWTENRSVRPGKYMGHQPCLLGRSREPPHDECVLGVYRGQSFDNWTKHKPSTSLDAALALAREVLPEFGVTVKAVPEPGAGKLCEAWLSRSHPTNATYEAQAATPALALCAAILTALKDKQG